MIKHSLLAWLIATAFCCVAMAAGDTSPEEFKMVTRQRSHEIESLADSGDFVAAVKAQNARLLSQSEIELRDELWIKSDSDDDRQAMLSAPVCETLQKFPDRRAVVFNELILVDRRGANVAAYPLTSDYWQGDEEKFLATYDSGRIYYGPVEYDASSDVYAMQISVPVKSGSEVIGVLIAGLRLSYAEARIQGYRSNASSD
jgi:hypothetical protein